jgi:hypothetical protein
MAKPTRAAEWWKQFQAAPPELQKAMNETKSVRESLEFLQKAGVEPDKMMAYRRKLEDLERHESHLRHALEVERKRASESPDSRTVIGIREEVHSTDASKSVDLDDL